jgi:hypothetical protein
MKSPTSSQILAMAILAITATVVPLHASSIPITYTLAGTGSVVGATASTLTLEAAAHGSFLSGNPAINSSWNPTTYSDLGVLDFSNGLFNGTFTALFASGDTLMGDIFEDQSAIAASATQTGPFSQTLTFTGGTGEFAGATGSVSGDGILGTMGFAVSGSGVVNVVATPEPTSGTLFLAGLVLLVAGAWRSGVSVIASHSGRA